MLRMIAALVISLPAVFFAGPRVVAWLRKLHFGQTIYELAPEAHKSKQGTPIMGGMMVAACALVCGLALHPVQWYGWQDYMLALLAVSLLSMLVGFADDYTKAIRKRSEGLTPWQKIAGQVIVAVGFSVYCYLHPQIGSSIIIPFVNVEWNLGIFYIPLMTLLVIFMVNSSNLQDGLDGLLSSVTMVSSVGWAAVAIIAMATAGANGSNLYSIGIFAMAVCGGVMGFLRVNYHPAKIFMGDSGSMFVGGAMVGMAMLLRQPFLLLMINFTLIMSSVSVIMQRTYFKLTHGKRIFRMSPIHHHFELSGMTEPQIDLMYAVITGALTLVAVLGLL